MQATGSGCRLELCSLAMFFLNLLGGGCAPKGQEPTLARPDLGIAQPDAHRDSAAKRSVKEGRGYLGVIVPRRAVDIAAKIPGAISSLQVQVGVVRKQGVPLATIDPRRALRDVAVAKATVAIAQDEEQRMRVEHSQSQVRLERMRPLAEGVAAISGDEMERAVFLEKGNAARLAAAQSSVREKQSQVAQQRTFLVDTIVRAPFDGTITARYVDVGSFVSLGSPIARISSLDDLLIRFAIPEDKVDRFAVGQALIAEVTDSEVPVEAILERITPEVDAASRMIWMEAAVRTATVDPQRVLAGRVVRVSASASAKD